MRASNAFLSMVLTFGITAAAVAQQSTDQVTRAEFPFEKSVLVEGLGNPYEIRLGRDGWLWVTERTGGKLSRVDPENGTIRSAYEFQLPDITDGAQTGVMGFAFHPRFGDGGNQVFVYITYRDETRTDPTRPDAADPYHRMFNKVVRLDYDRARERLTDPVDVLTGIPANNDHNSGRMEIGPDGMIYLTVGDQGHNQLTNACRPIEAQTLPTAAQVRAGDRFAYQGKVLRIALDGGIPADNPVINGVRSHVFSYGHRNPQGIAFGPDGTLYSDEHGPDTDDEINIIRAGGNYGWPHVAGQQDDRHYVYAQWSKATQPCGQLVWRGPSQGAPASVPQQKESQWRAPANYVAPVATMFTVDRPLPGCEDFGYFCRPSVGPSSIAWYGGRMPELRSRLLVTALKHGSIYAFDPAVGAKPGFTRYYLGMNRLRDLEIADEGRTIYVATDAKGAVQNPQGDGSLGLEDAGAILVYTARGNVARAAAKPAESNRQATEREVQSGRAPGNPATAPGRDPTPKPPTPN